MLIEKSNVGNFFKSCAVRRGGLASPYMATAMHSGEMHITYNPESVLFNTARCGRIVGTGEIEKDQPGAMGIV